MARLSRLPNLRRQLNAVETSGMICGCTDVPIVWPGCQVEPRCIRAAAVPLYPSINDDSRQGDGHQFAYLG